MHVVLALKTGGLERVVLDLVRKMPPRRYRPYICCLEQDGELAAEARERGVPVAMLDLRRVGGPAALRALVSLLRRHRIDLVNTHNPQPHKFGALAARAAKVPVVVHTKHGRNFHSCPFEHPRGLLYNHLLARITDKIIAVSDSARDVCLRYERVPPSRVVTIRNGVDVERFAVKVDRPALMGDLGLPVAARVVGNVARLSGEKDHATLFRAFARVVQASPDVYLVVVGDGPLHGELGRLAQDLGIAAHVRLTRTRHDIPELMKLFDVFVLSSITEGTSITLLEAIAAGVPVVATNVGGNPEVIRHGVSGLLCPARDARSLADRLLELLGDETRARQLADRARAGVLASYSLKRMVADYTALYDALLAEVGLS